MSTFIYDEEFNKLVGTGIRPYHKEKQIKRNFKSNY